MRLAYRGDRPMCLENATRWSNTYDGRQIGSRIWCHRQWPWTTSNSDYSTKNVSETVQDRNVVIKGVGGKCVDWKPKIHDTWQQGLKNLFVSTRTSCSELRTSCSGRKDKRILWSFRTMTWTLPRLRAVADPYAGAVGAIAPPPEWEWSLKSSFGNQFSPFVVIFLFHGLRNSSPITNLSPQDC